MERWLLLGFFIVYFSLTFAWRSWRVWRQTGINPYVLPTGDSLQGFCAKAFRLVLCATAVYAAAQALMPGIDGVLGEIELLAAPLAHQFGWALLLISLMLVGVAQVQMGSSWRIGIDTQRDTSLVSGGLFALSRNPIFLGMRISLLGLLLVRPNGLTLALLATADLLMQMQVRQEEEFLVQRHGAAYIDYCKRTPRWL